MVIRKRTGIPQQVAAGCGLLGLLCGKGVPMTSRSRRTAIKFKEAELKGAKGDILKFHDTVTDQE